MYPSDSRDAAANGLTRQAIDQLSELHSTANDINELLVVIRERLLGSKPETAPAAASIKSPPPPMGSLNGILFYTQLLKSDLDRIRTVVLDLVAT